MECGRGWLDLWSMFGSVGCVVQNCRIICVYVYSQEDFHVTNIVVKSSFRIFPREYSSNKLELLLEKSAQGNM
jgi:hypothetical protein